jgi:toluene monooxygenase system protein E
MAIRSGGHPVNGARGSREKALSKLKTYAHLAGQKRMPSDYEVVTTALLYYPGRGFEVNVPLGDFYAQYQTGSRLCLPNGERFADPRETTYAKYVAAAAVSEAYIDGIFASLEESRYDERVAVVWKNRLLDFLGAMRFPIHGLQMVSAYVGQMAPTGRVTACALFQAADEVRRIQRIAYRLTQLAARADPHRGRNAWQNEAAWQPLREVIERCLVAFDWGEALVALDICLKPIFDELFMNHLANVAKEEGDYLLGELFRPLAADCRWHQDWAFALLKTATEQDAQNHDVVAGWVASWQPRALDAAKALEPLLPGASEAGARASASIARRLETLGAAPVDP